MSDEESHWSWVALEEAEFEIARLRAQVAELREALKPFANLVRGRDSNYWLDGKWVLDARAALEMSGGVK